MLDFCIKVVIRTIWRLRKEGRKIGAEFKSEDEEKKKRRKSLAATAALRAATAARVGIQSEISCSFVVFYLFILLSFVIRFRIV